MTGRAMVLAAGLALLAAPQAMAQEDEGEAQMRQRAPRAQMRQHAQRGEMRQRAGAHLMFDRTIGQLMDRRHELGLTDGQMSALGDLRAEAESALGPIRDQMTTVREGVRDGTLTREAAHTAMQGVHEQLSGATEGLHTQLEEILEPEQRAMLRRGMAQRGSRGHMRRGNRQGRRVRPGMRGKSDQAPQAQPPAQG